MVPTEAAPTRAVRKDGFSCPSHPFQVASWGMYFCFVGSFYSLFIMPMNDIGRIIAGVIYGFFATMTLCGAVIATSKDPKDPLLKKTANESSDSSLCWCYRCEKHVRPSSKHCTLCNKCVDVFDHHCIWLNNCVGRQNIVPFYCLLIGAACMLGTQIGVGCYNIYVFVALNWTERQNTFYPSLGSNLGTFIPMLAVWVLCIIMDGLVIQLFCFHFLLVLRNITTFDYIVQRGQRNNGTEPTPGHGSSLGTWFGGYRKAPVLEGAPSAPQQPPARQLASTVPTVEPAALSVRNIPITVHNVPTHAAPAASADPYSNEPGEIFDTAARL